MSIDQSVIRLFGRFIILPGVAVILGLLTFGCAETEEATEEWETTPTVSPTAKLEYRVDSLKNENRRLKEQVDALAAENRSLTARNAELETKLSETAAAPKPVVAPSPTVSASGYEGALEVYRRRDFAAAAEQFDALLRGGISEDLADNCHYWMGESYYGMRRYTDAIQEFETVLGYRRSEKKDDAQMMIGNSYAALGNKAAAREAYEKVVSGYPTSSLVSKAQEKLAKLK